MINEWGSCSDRSGMWRKSFVVAMHPEKSAVMLVIGDCDGTGKGGDSNWLDVSKAKILVASGLSISPSWSPLDSSKH